MFGYPSPRAKFLCPWHDEKTPSCFVDMKHARVYCFGCGHLTDLEGFVTQMVNRGREAEIEPALTAVCMRFEEALAVALRALAQRQAQ